MMNKRLIIGISGSSAPILGIRLLEELHRQGEIETHLVISPSVKKTLAAEAPEYSIETLHQLADYHYPIDRMDASIASGSFPVHGMVVIPCSMRTLAAVAMGQGDNLLTRAADVTLKERRPLVVVPRETPLNLAHLRNMAAVTEMGGIILPPAMAFYHRPKTPMDLVDHCVGKVLDVLKIPHELFQRWKG
jgi:4-hydroxy-3-polyprenylbenzoate decarboxylase